MSTFLNEPFGTYTGGEYTASGVERLFAIPRNKVLAVATTADGTGTANIVTGFTLAAGAKFQEIVCVEDSASLQQPFKIGPRKLITQTVALQVDASGAAALEAHNQIVLTRSHMLIVLQRDGKMYVAGHSFGLKVTDGANNSGAKPEDEGGFSFTLGGPNLGPAPELQLGAGTTLDDYVNYAA